LTLESLQSTLDRIAEIRNRFEPALPAPTGAADNQGGFDAAMTQAMSGVGAPPVPGELDNLIENQADTQGVDANLLKAIIKNESNFNPKAVSSVGAQGLMQLMPGTAAGLGVHNSFDPAQNIAGGTKYIKSLLQKYDQSVPKAVAAYNAGPGAVDRHNGIPPFAETTRYVQKVMQSYKAYQNADRS
jgi:soluble lytic murein transglycosylase-like protein